MCGATEEGIVNPAVEQTTNDIVADAMHTATAGKNERSPEFRVSFSGALDEMDDNLSEKISPLTLSSSLDSAELAHGVESRRNELECDLPRPLVNTTPREDGKNDQESDAPSQDFDIYQHVDIKSTVGTNHSELPSALHVSSDVNAFRVSRYV